MRKFRIKTKSKVVEALLEGLLGSAVLYVVYGIMSRGYIDIKMLGIFLLAIAICYPVKEYIKKVVE